MKKPSKADLLIYKAFSKALEKNLLCLYLDTSKLNRPNSPVYNPWENLLPLLIPMIIGLFLILSAGPFWGLTFMIAMALVFNFGIKKIIDRRLLERTKKFVATDIEHCQKLWEHGGIVLAASDNKKIGCISPEGDWKEFVVKHFADFMVDKKTDSKETTDEQPAA